MNEDDLEPPETLAYLMLDHNTEEGEILWRFGWDEGMDPVYKADILSDLAGLLLREYNMAVEELDACLNSHK